MGAARAAPRLELADIVRTHGAAVRQAQRLTRGQHRALRAIAACRTAALGGHTEACDACGAIRIAYNSCRNRHCPKCQTLAKERWLTARRAELLPIEYFHVVFTLPHALNPLAQGNPRVIYHVLFQAATATLATFAGDPRHLGEEPVPDASGRAVPAVLPPPPIACPLPNAPGTPPHRGHKPLPLRPGPRYNPHTS